MSSFVIDIWCAIVTTANSPLRLEDGCDGEYIVHDPIWF